MDMNYNHLAQLPVELLQEILQFLDNCAFAALARSSKWGYEAAIPLIWHDVELIDCRTRHADMPYHSDEHDDTLIIKKLIVLASNAWIASQVHTLIHSCHLPPPALFSELPATSFQSRSLSHDPRTLLLLDRACANLSNLQTLRIIFGHWNITKGLLNGILHSSRKRSKPLRGLWLENCSLNGVSASMLANIDLHGLESMRLRRLQLLPHCGRPPAQQVYTRGGTLDVLQDGQGGVYNTNTASYTYQEDLYISLTVPNRRTGVENWEKLFKDANTFDDMIYDHVSDASSIHLPHYRNVVGDHRALVHSHAENRIPHRPLRPNDEIESLPAVLSIMKASATTLTSLNLDWLLIRGSHAFDSPFHVAKAFDAFAKIFSLRFPCLRAFQLRNCVVEECKLPPGLFLLDDCFMSEPIPQKTVPSDLCISFMEAHPNLRCLAWPMEMFFNGAKGERSARVNEIIENLAQSLVELRVDTMYNAAGDFQTEDNPKTDLDKIVRDNRRLFISEFAAKMRTVEHLKVEGSVPRDERRETVRALGACPLKKIVLIGVSSPVGNTWGLRGQDVENLGINEDFSDPSDLETLEHEDINAITQLGAKVPTPPDLVQPFQAEYGWPPSAPMIHTLAAYHAESITELKFCGYRGAMVLWDPTTITTPMYSPLRHFHNLETLILSLWLPTFYESDFRDEDVIAYWLNTRSSKSTALVAPVDAPRTGWARRLEERFAPLTVATRIKDVLGPFLSERVKSRPGGVHVRGSFCIGVYGGIFDFGVNIGKALNGEDTLLDWTGPREELHPIRKKEKLERRRWFLQHGTTSRQS